MTDRTDSRAARKRARFSSLYRSVLGLALAAVVAAWLPFSVFYFNALSKRVTSVPALSVPYSHATTTHLVTTASGATRVVASNSASPASATAGVVTPVTTRVS
jgi:hypothetical protein